ncbi:hypothetical protein [Leclercia adecarboxylata]|uniref:hypothetical protein n=1 Tax=Leclercia adecarboxylata TaxID=83655 RepID=UPI002B3179BA|nr:hypothetical protein NRF19_18850 [Leclercia adecarboxylata]
MTKFTKEQLIARVKQATAINRRRINANPDATGLAMDNELFAIALEVLTAKPFMYGITDPDGVPHFDEECVGSDAGILQDEVDCLNDAACGGDGPRGVESDEYRVVPLYRLPEIE